MRINYNKVTRKVWLSNSAGSTVDVAEAAPGEKMIDAAARLMNKHGFARTGDYHLAGTRSPMRYANVVPAAKVVAACTPPPRSQNYVPAKFGRGEKVHLGASNGAGRVTSSVPLCGTYSRPGMGVAVSGPVTCQKCLAAR